MKSHERLETGRTTPQTDSVEDFLDHAEMALDNGDAATAIESCQQALALEPKNPNALYLLGECYRERGDLDLALDTLRRCALADPHHSAAWSGLGILYQYFLQWEESRRALNRAIRENPNNAEAWYARGIIRERRGDIFGADRDLARACRLDAESFPFPPSMTDAELDEIVQESISELHPTLQDYLSNVAILVDEVPSEEVLRQYNPPLHPAEILGYFSGYSLRERSLDNPWSQLPNAIVIYRRNLQRYARDHETLIEQLRVTIYHEVGHFLGLDEDDLYQRGLD